MSTEIRGRLWQSSSFFKCRFCWAVLQPEGSKPDSWTVSPHTHTHASQCICNWKLYWFHSFICKICWRENVQNQPQNWLRYRDDSSVVNTWMKGKVRPEIKILSLSTHSANDGGPQNIYFGASQQNSVSWRADVDKRAKQNDIKWLHEARPHPNHQSSAFKWCHSHHRGAVGLVHPLQASVKILF